MKKLLLFYILILLVAIATSCTAITAIQKLSAEEATFELWSNGEKDVVFIPMIHISKPEFYEDVKIKITELKRQGFVVYYEGVQKVFPADSVLTDKYKRKLRKMLTFTFDSLRYTEKFQTSKIFKNAVDQPPAMLLGIDSNDKWVDVSVPAIVDAYEAKYGEIILQQGDYQLSLTNNGFLPAPLWLPRKNVNSILIGFRDQHLANTIHNSTDKKIVVVYGLMHMSGTLKRLQQEQPQWNSVMIEPNYP